MCHHSKGGAEMQNTSNARETKVEILNNDLRGIRALSVLHINKGKH